jgi:hypothetical protein
MNHLPAILRELKLALAYVGRAHELACHHRETALAQRLAEFNRDLRAEITSLELRRDTQKGS